MTSAGVGSSIPHGSTYTVKPSSCQRNDEFLNQVTPSSMASSFRLPRSVAPLVVVWQIAVASREPVEELGGVRAALSLLRRNPDFRKLYLASLISLGGDWFLLIALFGLTLDITGSAVSVAVLIASQEVPFFFMSPIGGVLTDRLNRKWLMVVCDVARAFLCLGFLFVNEAGTIWIAYPLLALTSSFAAIFDPASSAALPNLVEPRDLGPANALSGSLWGTMLAVGAGLGGLVAAVLGRDAAFLIDAASFALSGLLIARVRRPFSADRTEEPETNVIRATVDTIRYARRD